MLKEKLNSTYPVFIAILLSICGLFAQAQTELRFSF
jgi:hypothetical protein